MADNHGVHTERGLRPDLTWTTLLSPPGDAGRYPNWCAVDPLQRRTIGIQTLTTNGRPVDRLGRVVFRDVEHAATNTGILDGLGHTCSAPIHRLRLCFGHLAPHEHGSVSRSTRFTLFEDAQFSTLLADSLLAPLLRTRHDGVTQVDGVQTGDVPSLFSAIAAYARLGPGS
ncbi:hypothetical protein Poly51_64050 [Rubripirellula tenax]|uniref:Uncharacterized protein n=1 Tax=Rubripirellula tenax TaxID=2528015 RepID=A0A5C6DU97_9BACT|nr:hypothetical protein Poly51_64050 [Rubripirellula tenax]